MSPRNNRIPTRPPAPKSKSMQPLDRVGDMLRFDIDDEPLFPDESIIPPIPSRSFVRCFGCGKWHEQGTLFCPNPDCNKLQDEQTDAKEHQNMFLAYGDWAKIHGLENYIDDIIDLMKND